MRNNPRVFYHPPLRNPQWLLLQGVIRIQEYYLQILARRSMYPIREFQSTDQETGSRNIDGFVQQLNNIFGRRNSTILLGDAVMYLTTRNFQWRNLTRIYSFHNLWYQFKIKGDLTLNQEYDMIIMQF